MSIDQLMAQLRKDYLASMPGKIIHIEDLVTSGVWHDVLIEFHKLKGTGKTYGFPEVTVVGETVETVISQSRTSAPEAVRLGCALLREIYQDRSTGGGGLLLKELPNFHLLCDLRDAAATRDEADGENK